MTNFNQSKEAQLTHKLAVALSSSEESVAAFEATEAMLEAPDKYLAMTPSELEDAFYDMNETLFEEYEQDMADAYWGVGEYAEEGPYGGAFGSMEEYHNFIR